MEDNKAARASLGLPWAGGLIRVAPQGRTGFTDRTPIAGKIEGASPSGSRGCPIRSEFIVTEGQKAEVQGHLEGPSVEAGTALSDFFSPDHHGHRIWGQGARAPVLAQTQLNCIFLGESLRLSRLQFPALKTGGTSRGNQAGCHEAQQRRAPGLCCPGKAPWLVPTPDRTPA